MATFNNGESGLSVRTKINNVLQHTDGTASELVINDAGADVNFRVESDTNANALFVDGGTGNVGIGTSNPQQLLHLSGTVPDIRYTDTVGNEWRAGNLDGAFRFYDVTVAGERMRIDSSGNVGIGTTSPTATLTILGPNSAAGGLSLTSTTSDATTKVARLKMQHYTNAEEPITMLLGVSSGTENTLQIGGGSNLENVATLVQFYTAAGTTTTAGTERMRIDSTGNVGIGTTSPTNLLDVNADSIRVRTAQTPATAGAAGNQGEIAWDADYIYVCVATNTWKRVAIATW